MARNIQGHRTIIQQSIEPLRNLIKQTTR